ncbi:MAG: DUF1254 domain-containing protein [Burkholderiaceae bacterium]
MRKLLAMFGTLMIMSHTAAGAAAPAPITEQEAYAIGIEAYTYAYPAVLMDMTRRVRSNAVEPDTVTRRSPMNRFAHAEAYANADARDVVRPNADTLYSSLWYDVGQEPLVITVPDMGDRYHVIPFMDMWTDVFAAVGTRSTGNGGGSYALVGPRWKGTLPEGLRAIVSPTDVGYIIGRIQANGAGDYGNVHKLQAGLKAVPLSDWGKPSHVPAPGRVDPAVDMVTPAPEQTAKLDAAAFFATFAEVLKKNPPNATDYATVFRMERLGLVVGRSFDLANADPAVQRALARAVPDAYKRIQGRVRGFGAPVEGWINAAARSTKLGVYGNDYLLRAYIAHAGLGALPNEDAIYPLALTDGEGKPLTGASKYVLHFDKDRIPPADAFWSLTMYGADQFFVANPINRYAIGDRDPLALNADGSLDLYVQHESPGKDKEANWLPAPAGPFSMNLRLYMPRAAALQGSWTPPPIRRQP